MAFAAFTRTLPTPTATLSGFVCLLNEGWWIQADANAMDGNTFINGGGSIRCYTDSSKTTQLPVDVVEFVTGGSPSAQVWVRIPTYTGSSTTIYIESDAVATTQPSVTDVYGRNAVWQDFVCAYVGTDGTDHAGNFDLTESGAGSISATTTDGGIDGISFDGSVSLKTSSWTKLLYPISASFWGRRDPTSSTQCVYSQGSQSSSEWDSLLIRSGNNYEINIDGTNQGSTSSIPDNVWDFTCVQTQTDDNEIFINGVSRATDPLTTQPSGGMDSFAIGELIRSGSELYYQGDIAAFVIKNSEVNTDECTSQYNNQNSPSTFGTSSGWVTGGGTTRLSKTFTAVIEALERKNKTFTAVIDLEAALTRLNKVFGVNADLLQRSVKPFTVNTDLLQRRTKTFSADVDLLQRFAKNFDLLIDLEQRSSKIFSVDTALLQRQNKLFNVRVNLTTGLRLSKTFSSVSNLNQRERKIFSVTADVLNRISKDFQARFNINQRESKSFIMTVDTLERKAKTFTMVVRIDSDTTVIPAHYVVNVCDTVDFTPDSVTIEFKCDGKIIKV